MGIIKAGGNVKMVNKAHYESLLNMQVAPSKSPVKNQSLEVYHYNINKFAEKEASEGLRKRIKDKYKEFTARLVDKEYNPHYIEAMVLSNIANGYDSLSNYSGKMLLKLYLYFTQYYVYEASYNTALIEKLREDFSEIDAENEFKDVYLFSYPSEIKRCLVNVINGVHKLTYEEFKYFDSIRITTASTNRQLINKIYANNLNLGRSIGLEKEVLTKDFEKIYEAITTDNFKEKYQRPFNLVDMYLTTSVQVEDFSTLCDLDIDREKVTALYKWFKQMYAGMFVHQDFIVNKNKVSNIVSDLSAPSLGEIESFMSGDFGEYSYKTHTPDQARTAYLVLVDLNMRYGVKMDKSTYLYVLESVVDGTEDTYYAIGDEHKGYLDDFSHIEIVESPVFTRRVKNEGNK